MGLPGFEAHMPLFVIHCGWMLATESAEALCTTHSKAAVYSVVYPDVRAAVLSSLYQSLESFHWFAFDLCPRFLG